ncbi:MAG: DNA helicase RecG [Firmicutes bacterium HGW-Firmicutes-12]|nr:MAG: DNA helicase RecG [Firmicutes bacterium HGW-Firmicutes-12]
MPRRYEDRSNLKSLREIKAEEVETVIVKIIKVEEMRTRSSLRILKATISDHTETAFAVWYNQAYLKKQLKPGIDVVLTGKVKEYYGKKEINVIEHELISGDPKAYTGRILPIYSSTEGLSQKFWRDIQEHAVLKYACNLTDSISFTKRKEYELISLEEAIKVIHLPKDIKEIEKARYRLIFEELFTLQMSLYILRQEYVIKRIGISQTKDNACLSEFIKNLPFELTIAQLRVIREVGYDMEASKPMHRLLQGDVGSGKTVIAAWALLKTVGNGYLGVLMAPTEILAQQHYATINTWFKTLGINTSLLIGSMPSAEKKAVITKIATHDVNILIGTHALIQDSVKLDNVGLIIIDEQHRFGVKQREILEKKANNPDVLVMTATPIPRTLALTLYGELDISTLDELPPGRKNVETICIKDQSRAKVHKFIEDRLRKGAQIYVVCPLVDDSETLDLANAVKTADNLAKALSPYKVGLVHGKMNSKEKEMVMQNFYKGNVKLLVSTTVIEVGVNVPQATVMIIEDAERFGLAQLHQLRGRVGRGELQSYCILITKSNNPAALNRLKLLTNTHNGFTLAEEDLKQRGQGDFFGIKQHGLPEFKLADLSRDEAILLKARELVLDIIKNDPYLMSEEHSNLAKQVNKMLNKFIQF